MNKTNLLSQIDTFRSVNFIWKFDWYEIINYTNESTIHLNHIKIEMANNNLSDLISWEGFVYLGFLDGEIKILSL